MTDATLMKIDGACLCGKIRYEAVIDPAAIMVCHCTDCQVNGGGAFRWGTLVPRADFTLLAGTLKFYRKGVANRDVFAFIEQNIRSHETVMGDLGAQVSACHVGCERMQEICTEMAWPSLQGLANEIVTRSEAVTRAEIAKLRGQISVPAGSDNEAIIAIALFATIEVTMAATRWLSCHSVSVPMTVATAARACSAVSTWGTMMPWSWRSWCRLPCLISSGGHVSAGRTAALCSGWSWA